MVIFDANFLLLLIDPAAKPSVDLSTGEPITHSKERIEHLLTKLHKSGERIGIPTPALAEVLVGAQGEISELVAELTAGYKLKTLVFDEMAAVEVALMTDTENVAKSQLTDETKAKVKYDRQIIATAKTNSADAIYSDDQGLRKKAASIGLQTVGLADITLPPEAAQGQLDFEHQDETNL